jgi:hypothetical protein
MNSTKRQARLAGILYLLASIIGFFGLIYVPQLIVPGDATATADHVRTSETIFRLGIASELTGFIIFIFVVLALYRLFKAVDGKHALQGRIPLNERLRQSDSFIPKLGCAHVGQHDGLHRDVAGG